MNNEIMQFFELNKHFHNVPFLETDGIKKHIDNIKYASRVGGIIAITGMVGTGKTTLLWQIQQQLRDEKEVVVCRSLSTDKKRVNIGTLYTGLGSNGTANRLKVFLLFLMALIHHVLPHLA